MKTRDDADDAAIRIDLTPVDGASSRRPAIANQFACSPRSPAPAAMLLRMPRRVAHIAAVLSLTTIALWLAVTYRNAPFLHRSPLPAPPPPPEPPKFDLFGLKDFDAEVEISYLNLRPKFIDEEPPLAQQLQGSLPAFSTIRLDTNTSIADEFARAKTEHPPATLTVDVARQAPTPDASRLIIGAATTLGRLPDALRGFKHWASNTGVRFVVSVEPYNANHTDELTVAEAVELYKKHNISLTLIESTDEYLDRYVELIGILGDHLEPKTEWVSIIDDDTFFFSMKSLLDMLGKYDPKRPWYVGNTSENKWNVDDGGIFAIGGAGVFMSRALIQQLHPHADECVRLPNIFGDSRVADCVFKFTTTKLSMEHDLYQLDLHHDVTGFYEAIRPQPVSVHHWKTWHHHDMPTVASVSEVCGQPCVLQNFKFKDGWQMANGFSIIKYSYNETELATQVEGAMEHTWKLTIWDIPTSWKYSLEPLKPKDEGKIQFLIEKSEVDKTTGDVTLYLVRRKDGRADGIMLVTWVQAKGSK
ncbi:uncharacterized protein E0L32_007485 [Thyridium curvatum]|uniref:Fringe-like glycosyltransferase domain-containing protein n=1 Tax=Thyridium curvatum TaxID=1093900 RepID=A0A507B4F4_9PEZI|nr:uncharacterized protein E0L32_007485 [Thyridium curvatum]TPX11748.1 hypothetical protein E0L32_007485 [Thyridium curvatum]